MGLNGSSLLTLPMGIATRPTIWLFEIDGEFFFIKRHALTQVLIFRSSWIYNITTRSVIKERPRWNKDGDQKYDPKTLSPKARWLEDEDLLHLLKSKEVTNDTQNAATC